MTAIPFDGLVALPTAAHVNHATTKINPNSSLVPINIWFVLGIISNASAMNDNRNTVVIHPTAHLCVPLAGA